MIKALLLNLGMLLSSAPGLGAPTDFVAATPTSPIASLMGPALRPTFPDGLPGPVSREETILSYPEEKEEESDQFLLGWAAYHCDRISTVARGDHAIVEPVTPRGFLHQLHHTWQLRC